MTEKITDIANKFLAEQVCSKQELGELKKWLSNPSSSLEVEAWLSEHWAMSPEIDSGTMIESVFQQIEACRPVEVKAGLSLTRILKIYQRIAAFLLIPIIGCGILYWVSNSGQSYGQLTETIAPRGQKSQIVLADGTKVWLNSDTKIKYPGNFSKCQRDVYLEGEAFFEVAKNPRQPFFVHTSGVNVKVLGTKFNVKAYPDEGQVETSLFEGKINLLMDSSLSTKQVEQEITPGQSFMYSKTSHQLEAMSFPREEIDGWKNNQLIFKDDTFSNLVKKVERWYDVKVVYDEKLFNDRRLTVELYEGERLERLLEIISKALSVNYIYEKGEISLKPKPTNM
jgi:ferric-dicitrate binding protein FerR (iron transport regulator)